VGGAATAPVVAQLEPDGAQRAQIWASRASSPALRRPADIPQTTTAAPSQRGRSTATRTTRATPGPAPGESHRRGPPCTASPLHARGVGLAATIGNTHATPGGLRRQLGFAPARPRRGETGARGENPRACMLLPPHSLLPSELGAATTIMAELKRLL
jgi:hypothetical protein